MEYYVGNEYSDPEMQETLPEPPLFDKLTRNILASNACVTKFKIIQVRRLHNFNLFKSRIFHRNKLSWTSLASCYEYLKGRFSMEIYFQKFVSREKMSYYHYL